MAEKKFIPLSTEDRPAIEFPCAYPVKVVGLASSDFESEVVAVTRRHAPGLTEDNVVSRASKKGNYLSVTVTIEATGKDQLERLFLDLKTLANVKLVL